MTAWRSYVENSSTSNSISFMQVLGVLQMECSEGGKFCVFHSLCCHRETFTSVILMIDYTTKLFCWFKDVYAMRENFPL